jgi:isopentenyl phosphate kinase
MPMTDDPAPGAPPEVVLVKLGGSLITEKSREGVARHDDIVRLAAEIARALPHLGARLVLGHGSGSFGHAAAHRSGIAAGLRSPAQLVGIARTQDRAAALHRLVVGALLEAGLAPFSIAPSNAVVTHSGEPAGSNAEPLLRALEIRLLPVVYGDVVLDRDQGVAILSTEGALAWAAEQLLAAGYEIRRALWCGETDGLYDGAGKTVPHLSADAALASLDSVVDPAGPDVTGGMRLRLATALRLARRGIPSLLLNGRTPGALERALLGAAVPGTEIG